MAGEDREELADLRARLSELQQSVAALGERVRSLESGATPAPAESPPAARAPRAAVPAPPHRRPPARSGPRPGEAAVQRLRDFLSEGNPLNKLGALSMIIGAGIVFKYAVDNDWIGPTGRVVLGLVTGSALLVAGELYARRDWQRFAAGLVSAGNGVLFIAVWFGQQQYEVIPPAVAFALYVAATAFVVAQSLRYDSMALAIWGLLGGYLTPALASTGSGNYALLSTYLLVLNAGVFAIAYWRSWQPLKWMAFAITVAYTSAWVYAFEAHPGATRWLELHWLLPFLAAFFVSFAAIPTWRSLLRREPIDAFGQLLTVANGIVHFLFAVVALHDEHRAWLGLAASLIAGLYAVVASRLTRAPTLDAPGLRVFAGTASGFLLLATPYLASGHWITLVWCAETLAIAWACTRPRFEFLRLHVVGMLAIILIRLVAFDEIFSRGWTGDTSSYVPFAELRSWPPFAATATFAGVAWLLGRVRGAPTRLPVQWLIGIGALVLVAAVDGETSRLARHAFVPLGSSDLQDLVRAGLLIALVGTFWLAVRSRLAAGAFPWLASLVLAVALLAFSFEALLWSRSYGHQTHILSEGAVLPWLHFGVLLMLPLPLMLVWLARGAPESALGISRERLQALLLGIALVLAMLLLRRETFAITHTPPLMDLFSNGARQASYRSILSVSYALLALGVYVVAIRRRLRMGLYAAYALYVVTALKVYLFDLESQNQLYRASSLIIFAVILFASSYYANRQANRHAKRLDPGAGGGQHA